MRLYASSGKFAPRLPARSPRQWRGGALRSIEIDKRPSERRRGDSCNGYWSPRSAHSHAIGHPLPIYWTRQFWRRRANINGLGVMAWPHCERGKTSATAQPNGMRSGNRYLCSVTVTPHRNPVTRKRHRALTESRDSCKEKRWSAGESNPREDRCKPASGPAFIAPHVGYETF